MAGGFRGRQQARLQTRIEELGAIGNQLQQDLEESGTNGPQRRALVDALKSRLDGFPEGSGAPDQRLQLELAKATLACAENRYSDALGALTVRDPKADALKGNAWLGLAKWSEALEAYKRAWTVDTNQVSTLLHIADCQSALHLTNEAISAYSDAAQRYENRAQDLLFAGKTETAIAPYGRAIEINQRLIQACGQTAVIPNLARCLQSRANAFLLNNKAEAAAAEFAKAIDLFEQLNSPAQVAKCRANQGNAFLLQGKMDLAVASFDKVPDASPKVWNNAGNALLVGGKFEAALERFAKALELDQTRGSHVSEVARSHNNRGVIFRAQNKSGPALEEFNQAMDVLTKSPLPRENPTPTRSSETELDVAMGFTDKGIDALSRVRFADQGMRREAAVVLAISLKNRAHLYLAQGKIDLAMADLNRALETNAKLVELDGFKDLSIEFARSLSPLAWIYATNPNDSVRDGAKARNYAIKACELTQGRAYFALEALAAANAETHNFPEAIQWQTKAIEVAPNKFKAEMRARLENYKASKPWRAPQT